MSGNAGSDAHMTMLVVVRPSRPVPRPRDAVPPRPYSSFTAFAAFALAILANTFSRTVSGSPFGSIGMP